MVLASKVAQKVGQRTHDKHGKQSPVTWSLEGFTDKGGGAGISGKGERGGAGGD